MMLLSDLDLRVLLVDPNGRIVYANPRAETALAAQPGTLKSLLIDSLFSLRNPQWLAHEMLKSAANDQWAGEVVLSKRDGNECWTHVKACRCPAGFGMPGCMLIEFEDITSSIELMTTLMKRNEELYQRNRELEVVGKVSRLLLADTDLEYRLATILKEAVKTIGVSCGVIWVKSRDGRELVVRSIYGLSSTAAVNHVRISVEAETLSARVVAAGRAEVVEDLETETTVFRGIIRERGVKSAMCVPMIANDEVIGAIALGETQSERRFTAEEVTLVEVVANSTAAAISRALLAEDVEMSRTYWQRTFDSIEDLMAVVDPSGIILRANQALAACAHSAPSAIMGERCEEFMPSIRGALLERIALSAKPQDLGSMDIAGKRCAVRACPMTDAAGRIDAVVISARVLTNDQQIKDAAA